MQFLCNITQPSPLTYVLFPHQGPYTNVLDLYLFPLMSKRHSEKLQIYNNTEGSKKQIWDTVCDVWNSTASSEVARSFVLAYRVMQMIIRENGNNSWLAEGTPHCGVRSDFVDTDQGIRRKVVHSVWYSVGARGLLKIDVFGNWGFWNDAISSFFDQLCSTLVYLSRLLLTIVLCVF